MIFFWADTPDGWGIPGIHGPLAEDELDGYVQSGVYLIRGKGENLLIDSGNWTLPEYNNGMGDFLVRVAGPRKEPTEIHLHYTLSLRPRRQRAHAQEAVRRDRGVPPARSTDHRGSDDSDPAGEYNPLWNHA